MQSNFAGEDGNTDGDNDHPEHTWPFEPADKDHFYECSDDHGDDHSQTNGHGEAHETEQADGYHASQHDKLTLGKVDDTRGVIDDIKTDGHNGLDRAIGDTGKNVLNDELDSHKQLKKEPGTNSYPALQITLKDIYFV